MSAILTERSETQLSLDLTIDQAGIGGVTGKAPTVAIRLASSLNNYLDFSDFQFKTAGWGTKYAPLSEVEKGHYSRNLDLSAVTGVSVGDMLVAEYSVNDGGDVVGEGHDLFVVVKSISNIPGDVWDEVTSAHTTAGTFGATVQVTLSSAQVTMLTEIYKILGLDPTSPLIVSKVARTAGAVTQVIEENVPSAGAVKVTRT